MMPVYPNLVAEVAKRGIRVSSIATILSISSRALSNKMKGRTAFTWPEACKIKNNILPDCEYEYIFAEHTQPS